MACGRDLGGLSSCSPTLQSSELAAELPNQTGVLSGARAQVPAREAGPRAHAEASLGCTERITASAKPGL